MIITLTLNPAVDQTVWVERLNVGAKNRYHDSELDPAGKGVNASRMAHRLGWPTVAFGFLAGEVGQLVERALEAEGVQHHFVPIPGQTRIDVMVVEEATGAETRLYGPGPLVAPEHLATLQGLVEFWLQGGRVLVLAGSLPPGVPADAYAGFIRRARERGVLTILDTSGEPLRLGMEARPYLITPDRAEAEQLLGRPLPDLQAVVEGARELAERGPEVVIISLGAAEAICVQDGRAWRALSPPIERRSAVGTGDSLVAGLAVAAARGEGIVEGLRLGTAAAAATAMSPGTSLGTARDVSQLLGRVRVEELAPPAAWPVPSPAAEAPPPLAPSPRADRGGLWSRLLRALGRHVFTVSLEPPKRPVGPRERLRYGMDIDGTITQAPRHFKRLIDALLAAGDHVYIVTARPESDRPTTEAMLEALGIQYDDLMMRPDNWRGTVPDFKVQAVRKRELHLLMDDDPNNCWAVVQRTEALAGHMLPIPETPEEPDAMALVRELESELQRR